VRSVAKPSSLRIHCTSIRLRNIISNQVLIIDLIQTLTKESHFQEQRVAGSIERTIAETKALESLCVILAPVIGSQPMRTAINSVKIVKLVKLKHSHISCGNLRHERIAMISLETMGMTVPLMIPPDAMPARLVTIAPNQGGVIFILLRSVNMNNISPP
jgi:hypothetical protein